MFCVGLPQRKHCLKENSTLKRVQTDSTTRSETTQSTVRNVWLSIFLSRREFINSRPHRQRRVRRSRGGDEVFSTSECSELREGSYKEEKEEECYFSTQFPFLSSCFSLSHSSCSSADQSMISVCLPYWPAVPNIRSAQWETQAGDTDGVENLFLALKTMNRRIITTAGVECSW